MARLREEPYPGSLFQPDLIVDGLPQPLLAAQVSLRGLHRIVAQQELSLLQFATRCMAYPLMYSFDWNGGWLADRRQIRRTLPGPRFTDDGRAAYGYKGRTVLGIRTPFDFSRCLPGDSPDISR
jgi:hypothetical protein